MDAHDILRMDTTTMPWEERYQAALGKSNFRDCSATPRDSWRPWR